MELQQNNQLYKLYLLKKYIKQYLKRMQYMYLMNLNNNHYYNLYG